MEQQNAKKSKHVCMSSRLEGLFAVIVLVCLLLDL